MKKNYNIWPKYNESIIKKSAKGNVNINFEFTKINIKIAKYV